MSPTPEASERQRNAALKAWETTRARKAATAKEAKDTASEIFEQAEAVETTLSLERDLQRALRANIEQLQQGLQIHDGGKEISVPSGRIDILAIEPDKTRVVIELKAGVADRDAVGQILSYIGDLQSENKGSVRGILIAGDFTTRAVAAARAVSVIQLRKYRHNFSFDKVQNDIREKVSR